MWIYVAQSYHLVYTTLKLWEKREMVFSEQLLCIPVFFLVLLGLSSVSCQVKTDTPALFCLSLLVSLLPFYFHFCHFKFLYSFSSSLSLSLPVQPSPPPAAATTKPSAPSATQRTPGTSSTSPESTRWECLHLCVCVYVCVCLCECI